MTLLFYRSIVIVLTLQSLIFTIHTASFVIQKATLCLQIVFSLLYVSRNKQRLFVFVYLMGFFNRDGARLLRGTKGVCVYNSGVC